MLDRKCVLPLFVTQYVNLDVALVLLLYVLGRKGIHKGSGALSRHVSQEEAATRAASAGKTAE